MRGVVEIRRLARMDDGKADRGGGGDEGPLHHHQDSASQRDHRLVRRARLASHDVAFRRFHAQGERRQAVRDQVDPQDLDRGQRGGPADQGREEHEQHFARVAGEQVADELLDIVENPAALFDGADDRGEVVVGQHHIRCFLGDVGARDAHGNADVGGFDRRSVVDAVPRHGHDLATLFPGLHDAQLVLGRNAGVDGELVNAVGEFVVRQLVEVRHR